MKKVKILLSAIIVLSVVGGVFAFKATKRHTLVCTVALMNNACPPTRKCAGGVMASFQPSSPVKNICANVDTNVDCTKIACAVLINTTVE